MCTVQTSSVNPNMKRIERFTVRTTSCEYPTDATIHNPSANSETWNPKAALNAPLQINRHAPTKNPMVNNACRMPPPEFESETAIGCQGIRNPVIT